MSTLKDKNYYEVLEIEKTATKDEIKRAYFKVSKKYHPDLNKSDTAEEDFKIVTEAYETLYDDNRRSNYDSYIKSGNSNNYSYNETYNNSYFDPSWVKEYMVDESKIDQFSDRLNILSQDEILISYDFFWRTYWSGSSVGQKSMDYKTASSIFNIFAEKINDGTYSSFVNSPDFTRVNDGYVQGVKNILCKLKMYRDAGASIFNFIADLINEDNFFDVPYVSILGLINRSITLDLYQTIEYIWEKNKHIEDMNNNGNEKINHKKIATRSISFGSIALVVVAIILLFVFLF